VIIILLFDAAWMYLLSIYIENVVPGEFGVPASPLFPLHMCFPFLKPKSGDEALVNNDGQASADGAVREPHDTTAIGIEVNRVTKIYPSRTVGGTAFKAVENLSMKMHTNQVTALLGQNGAGKSKHSILCCRLLVRSHACLALMY
jgi:ABC-type glutathione transport system ATPase component